MSKKTIKAAKTASKTTKATADKTARAKELKRIRDAKYRAKKQAAKAQAKAAAADKPKEQAKPDGGCKHDCDKCGCGIIEQMLAASAILAQGLALRAIAEDEKQPIETRKMCHAAWRIGSSALNLMRGGKEGK